jgi:hypothetical protein
MCVVPYMDVNERPELAKKKRNVRLLFCPLSREDGAASVRSDRLPAQLPPPHPT